MKILTIQQAMDKGMEALTMQMKKNDPVLRQVFLDMEGGAAKSDWSLVQETADGFAIWRVPVKKIQPYHNSDGSIPRRRLKDGVKRTAYMTIP